MVNTSARRTSVLPRVLVVGASAGLLATLAGVNFVSVSSGRSLRRTGLQSFKDDFLAWKATLTPEERAVSLEQAQNEFNKKYKSTENFKKELPEEKVNNLRDIVSKFLDTESADYKKAKMQKSFAEDNELIDNRIARMNFDFSLRPRLTEIDRDAERRYFFASERFEAAAQAGSEWLPAPPAIKLVEVNNTGAENHARNKQIAEQHVRIVKAMPGVTAEQIAMAEKFAASLPAEGTPWEMWQYRALLKYYDMIDAWVDGLVAAKEAEMGPEKFKAWFDKEGKDDMEKLKQLEKTHTHYRFYESVEQIEDSVDATKAWFRNSVHMPGKTKADMVREMWKVAEAAGKQLPPLDEEILADIAKYPAHLEGEYKHSWGTAEKLWKMECVDPYGMVFLLGVFDTEELAIDAFNAFNVQYEEGRAMKIEEARIAEEAELADLDSRRDAMDRLRRDLQSERMF